MKKIFHTYIKKYQFLTPERLYGDYVKLFETQFTAHDSTIYMIVKCRKPKWIAGSIKFLRDYRLAAKIEVDGIVHPIVIGMDDFWYDMVEMTKHFRSKDEMMRYFMRRSDGIPWRWLPEDLRYKFRSSFSSIEQEGKLLRIECEFRRNTNEQRESLTDLYLYQAMNFYSLPQPKLDIIYIGSSLKGTFSRLQDHEKWGWIQAQKAPDEDLLVYFCEIEGTQFEVGDAIVVKNGHGLSRQDETLVTEMALINYFKPREYNDKHVERDIRHSDRVKKALIKNGFQEVHVEMLLDGNIAKLGSPHVPRYGEHSIRHDIA
jgi:hypothetical protein